MNGEWSENGGNIRDDIRRMREYGEQHMGYEPSPCDRGEHAWTYYGLDGDSGLARRTAVRCLICGLPNPDHPAVKAALDGAT